MNPQKELKINLESNASTANPAEFFINSFLRTPNKIALECENTLLSYSQLFKFSSRIQSTLDSHCPSETKIGIFAHKSPLAYAAVLGTLFSQKAYVPLNPAFPMFRNHYILNKANISSVIVGDECLEAFESLLPELITSNTTMKIICENNSKTMKLIEDLSHHNKILFIPIELRPNNVIPKFNKNPNKLAYILFTSGSTGQPKGVMVKCDNVIQYINNMINKYPFTPRDRFSGTFDLTFDVSVHDMFTCWSTGSTLIPIQNHLLSDPIPFIRKKKITIWFSVPSIPLAIESNRLAEDNSLPDLMHSFFAGEKFPYASYQTWKKIAPNSTIYNLYGPTEATVTIINYQIQNDLSEEDTVNGIIPIGYPVQGQRTVILNEKGEQCPPNTPGKLFVSGSQITAGYLNEPKLTSRSFVSLAGQNGTWYDTGDIVVLDKKKCHHYIGRTDQQVQIMGYRVELGEIEHVLEKVTGSSHSIVGTLTNTELGIEEIYAVLLSNVSLSKKEIRFQCRKYLPGYMMPKKIHFIDQYPINSSGKIDRLKIHNNLLGN